MTKKINFALVVAGFLASVTPYSSVNAVFEFDVHDKTLPDNFMIARKHYKPADIEKLSKEELEIFSKLFHETMETYNEFLHYSVELRLSRIDAGIVVHKINVLIHNLNYLKIAEIYDDKEIVKQLRREHPSVFPIFKEYEKAIKMAEEKFKK